MMLCLTVREEEEDHFDAMTMGVETIMATAMVLGIREVSSNIILVSTITTPLTPDTHTSFTPSVLSSTPPAPTLHHYPNISFNAVVIGDHLGLMQVVPLNFVRIKHWSRSNDVWIWK